MLPEVEYCKKHSHTAFTDPLTDKLLHCYLQTAADAAFDALGDQITVLQRLLKGEQGRLLAAVDDRFELQQTLDEVIGERDSLLEKVDRLEGVIALLTREGWR
uniref:Uncharacterized protein n=1 Tax=viral metagenome TaxID=1070528 RepID=A0A6M3LAN0_9ZZZZ